MRGVSTPSHEYARVAKMYVHSLTVHPSVRDTSLEYTLRSMTTSTRAYTRVVLRLRAQAEKESATSSASTPPRSSSVPPSASGAAKAANGYAQSRSMSRPSSRAPSPTMSNYSHFGGGSSQVGHGSQSGLGVPTMQHRNSSQTSLAFRSPLFRLRRAPLLRVFVPSPEGDWLSDKSVMDCETECKKAGVLHLMRMGDVVWDIAVGDEGNVGRLVYDGKYLLVSSPSLIPFLLEGSSTFYFSRILTTHTTPSGICQNTFQPLLSPRPTSIESSAQVPPQATPLHMLTSRPGVKRLPPISSCFKIGLRLKRESLYHRCPKNSLIPSRIPSQPSRSLS
jgi:hypothetical protein